MSNYTNFDASPVRAGLGASRRMQRYSKYAFVDFTNSVGLYTDRVGGTAGIGDAAINEIFVGGEMFTVRVEQAVAAAAPLVRFQNSATLTGMSFLLDAVATDGVALTIGSPFLHDGSTANTNSKGAFTVGTDEAFFVRVKLSVADVSDSTNIAVGFSTVPLIDTAVLESRDDFFALNIDAGDIKIESDVNNGGPAAVDTTSNLADGGTVTLEVRVSASGVAKALIDNAEPATDVTGFTFDDTDVIYPFFEVLNNVTTSLADPNIIEWESGYIRDRGLDNINDLTEDLQTDFAVQ